MDGDNGAVVVDLDVASAELVVGEVLSAAACTLCLRTIEQWLEAHLRVAQLIRHLWLLLACHSVGEEGFVDFQQRLFIVDK